jgi:hypothetical protein
MKVCHCQKNVSADDFIGKREIDPCGEFVRLLLFLEWTGAFLSNLDLGHYN